MKRNYNVWPLIMFLLSMLCLVLYAISDETYLGILIIYFLLLYVKDEIIDKIEEIKKELKNIQHH
ncbi:MAG: hypothetical protein A3B89_01360 [Candidatus Buchananbacteria bacterium RIFCSPHIGHO2_02_FULL_40_13]|uniref:Uncharacterized protein n=1 Tax=Candidatus Buchananbacteria bacterium RIFCSPLOWO2_01_FULL_39_33 TaxID=1797543 RepID=A0A1G1YL84_9BACT|nr:MAG: hypothetical protein A2820_03515 [Candidatus Buchananbacteria bacterium RIFCSPHIGHO2_01_FULL_40_35]OGY50136.1 MAG: hypothetical protein A3B89_01360 [Candidatus Buchananbacteria bacterium RIFCSPHIGHO2_02_FULL_40_13]OGY53118.1 MAG: hypothetical protein A3A02_00175 [Candidatus Buchananbacteria bacterium RIFCSPLOWO2_01_FULL_39_33]